MLLKSVKIEFRDDLAGTEDTALQHVLHMLQPNASELK